MPQKSSLRSPEYPARSTTILSVSLWRYTVGFFMVPESSSSHTVRHPSSYLLYLPNPAIDSRLQLIEEQRILSLLTKICNLWFFSTFITLLGNISNGGMDWQTNLRNFNILLQMQEAHFKFCNLLLNWRSHLIAIPERAQSILFWHGPSWSFPWPHCPGSAAASFTTTHLNTLSLSTCLGHCLFFVSNACFYLLVEKCSVYIDLPVCFARLSDIGLEKGSNSTANERVQCFIWWIFTESEHSQLEWHWFVGINHWCALNESQAAEHRGEFYHLKLGDRTALTWLQVQFTGHKC